MDLTESLPALTRAALAGDDGQPAILFEGVWYDWGYLRRLAERLDDLLREAGVGPDESIAFAAKTRPESAAALLSLMAGGREIVMLYSYQSPEALGRKLRELRCAAVIGSPEMWDGPTREAAIETGALGIALEREAAVAVEATRFQPGVEHRKAASPGIAMLTSGTTGAPKHFHMTYEVIKQSMIEETGLKDLFATRDRDGSRHPSMQALPFGNISGLYGFIPKALGRQPLLMLEKPSLDAWLENVRRGRPKVASMVPAMLRVLMDRNVPKEDLSSLEYMMSGAATVDPTLHREFEARYGIPLLILYGATEFGGIVARWTPEDYARYGKEKFGAVGRASGRARLRVVDAATGEVLPPNTEGLLEVLSPRIGPDWIHTTDLAKIDEDGFMYHLGRADGAIMRGGFKIVPEQVAAALAEHPAVAVASVVGIPERRLGEVPVAAYQLRPGAADPDGPELEAHMRARLPATHQPVHYRKVETMPRTGSLKIDMAAVKALFADLVEDASKAGATR